MKTNERGKKQPNKFPWDKAMQFGFGILHLSPKDFWSMSLIELESALQAYFGHKLTAIGRNSLNDLMQKYPDKSLLNK